MRGNRNIGLGLIIAAALSVLVFTLLPYLAPDALGAFGGLFCGGGTLRVSTDNFVQYQCVTTVVSEASPAEEAAPEPTAEATQSAAADADSDAAEGEAANAPAVEEVVTAADNPFGLLMYVLSLVLLLAGVYFLTVASPPQKPSSPTS